MGKVIALPLSGKIETRQPQGGSAEILFFTGVRYYRFSDEEFAKLAAPAPQRRGKAKSAVAKSSVAKPAMDKSGLAKTAAASRKLA